MYPSRARTIPAQKNTLELSWNSKGRLGAREVEFAPAKVGSSGQLSVFDI